jgi:hypothetical protein
VNGELTTTEAMLLIASTTFVAAGAIARLLIPVAGLIGLVLMLVGELGLLATIAPEVARDHPAIAVLGVACGLAIAAMIGWLLANRPTPILIAGAIALTLRIPITIDGETYNQLLPLYGVLAVGCSALLVSSIRARKLEPRSRVWPLGPMLAVDTCVAMLVTLTMLSLSWSVDVDSSAKEAALFIGPFALLYVVVRHWLSAGVSLRLPALAFGATMVCAALVGIWQHWQRELWQNPKLIVANTFTPDFRTNSVYWDPNVYGRALVLALLLAATWWAVRNPPRRQVAVVATCVAVVLMGLWFTYSQSSFLALSAGLVALTVLLVSKRSRLLLVCGVLVVLIAVPIVLANVGGKDVESRARIARHGVVLATQRPVYGIGQGAFATADRLLVERRGDVSRRLRESHTTPITVLAELGLLGAGLWLALLVSAAGAALGAVGAYGNRVRTGEDALSSRVGPACWAGAALAAITAHSLLYASFFEDPATWLALAIVASAPLVTSSDA